MGDASEDQAVEVVSAAVGQPAKKKSKKKKPAKGGTSSNPDGEEALGGEDALGEAADGAGKSASQVKREKQKAAAARRKAAAIAASSMDTHFSGRYADGEHGLIADRDRLLTAATPNTERYQKLRGDGMEGQQISEIMRAAAGGGCAPPTFEEATATLLSLGSLDAQCVQAADATRVLLGLAQAEVEQLQPGSNPKLLPRTLKWCATNMAALAALLELTPQARADAPAGRLGVARLSLVQLLDTLVAAKRPPISAALAACRPPLVASLARLMRAAPTSTIFGCAVVHFLRSIFQAGSKPLRDASLTGAEPLQAVVVAALAADVSDVSTGATMAPLAPLRPFWIEIASVLQTAAAADKHAKAILAAQPGWPELEAALPTLRERYSEGCLCGPPPARTEGVMEGDWLRAVCERMQSMSTG